MNRGLNRVGVATAGLAVAGLTFAGIQGGEHGGELAPAQAHEMNLNDAETLQLIVDQQPGVVGEKPCGPAINIEEATRRFEAGDQVVKPVETSSHFEAHPHVEEGHSEFMRGLYGEELIAWIIDNKEVKQPDLLVDGADNSIARELMARMSFRVLDHDVVIQNHQCNIETGEIFEVNNLTRLKRGEQVWSLDFSPEEMEQMGKDGVEIPDMVPVSEDDDPEVEVAILAERGPCVNPLSKRRALTITQESTSTTNGSTTSIPSSTTTTTHGSTTSSSTTTTVGTTSTSGPRPEVSPPAPTPVQGRGDGEHSEADNDNNPNNNTTTSTTERPRSTTSTTNSGSNAPETTTTTQQSQTNTPPGGNPSSTTTTSSTVPAGDCGEACA
jgi:hypothetical protein